MILDYLEALHELPTIDEVWSLLVRQMDDFGFDRLLYGFTRYRTSTSFGDRDDLLILSNHDDDYLQEFIDGGMYANAPMVNWAVHNVGACSWRWLAENRARLGDKERAVIRLNRKHGITAGYSISFKDISSRAKGAIGLVARAGMTQDDVDALWDEHGRVIVQINNATHLKLSSLPFTAPRRPLTQRQREVLEWVGDGKTTQDIATIMDLRPATIEKHLRLARETLQVETTAQAVLKASIHNQIFVLAEH
jgi:LuxR family transcriptional regulator, quorum-sensing system regulator SdiA